MQLKTRIQKILDGEYTPNGAYADVVDELYKATKSSEVARAYANYDRQTESADAYALAGRVFRLQSQLAVLRRGIEHPTGFQTVWRSTFGTRNVGYEDMAGKDEMARLSKEARSLADVPLKDVLSLSVYLTKQAPTDKQIGEWYNGAVGKAQIGQYFGPEGSRRDMAKSFLSEWQTIRMFADQYAPKDEK